MLKSSNQEYFFETDVSQSKREQRAAKASNKFGNPVALKSKLLAAVRDPREPSCIYVAESAGFVRRVNVDTGKVTATFRGPTAPLTSLALSPDGATVYAGCWDGSIWSWTVTGSNASDTPRRLIDGHTDFAKTVLCVPDRRSGSSNYLVVSGGADRKLIVWDPESGKRLYALQDEGGGDDAAGSGGGRMLAPQCLALEPGSVEAGAAVVVSGSSDPGLRRWRIGREGGELVPWAPAQVRKESAAGKQAAKSPVKRLVVHDTSVYHVAFDLSDYDDDEDGAGPSLWTASADGTAKLISATGAVEETLQHGDYVRAIATTDHWVLTAGRTEDVKVWDKTGGELKFVLEGHYDEVTDLVVLEPALAAGVAERGRPLERLVSVGLDGTVRTWLLDEPALEEEVKKQADAKRLAKEGGNAGNNDGENKQAGVGLTAEEEAELAALMDEDDE